MTREYTSGSAVMGAFLLGGLVGAAIALLTAPKSGQETREDLCEWAEGAAERTSTRARQIAQDTGERARHFAQDAGERVRGFASTAGEKVKTVAGDASEKIKQKLAKKPGDAEPETEGEA